MNSLLKHDKTALSPSFSVHNYIMTFLQIDYSDFNQDGLADKITVKASAIVNPSTIRSIAIIQQFSYEIKSKVLADIKLSTYNFLQTPVGAERIYIQGHLVINQKGVYEQGSVKRVINYETDNLQTYLQQHTLNEFIDYIDSQNTTCNIEYDYKQIRVPSGLSNKTEIQFDISIPAQQEIIYEPTVLESIKIAWIQYVALLIPSMYIIYFIIIGFAFKNKVFDSQVRNDIRDEIYTYEKGYMYSRKF